MGPKIAGGGTVGIEHRGQVQLDGVIPPFIRGFMQRAVAGTAATATRNVINSVNAAVNPAGGVEGEKRGARIGGVAGHDLGIFAEHGGGERDVLDVASDGDNLRSSFDESFGGGQSDSGGAANDYNDFSVERNAHDWPMRKEIRITFGGEWRQRGKNVNEKPSVRER